MRWRSHKGRLAALAIWAMAPASAVPLHAQADQSIDLTEDCLLIIDRVFETTLDVEIEDEALSRRIDRIVYRETTPCLVNGLRYCDAAADQAACHAGLAAYYRQRLREITDALPEEIDAGRTMSRTYGRTRDAALAGPRPDQCAMVDLNAEDSACDAVQEIWPLTHAFMAWRMARRVGTMPLEGHPPIDLGDFQ